jgi:hypothetical protein
LEIVCQLPSQFVISLDFELLWGLRDHQTRDSYGGNILGVRDAIPRMLDLFAKHGISATWATVGLLFCEDKDEMLDCVSRLEQAPDYNASKLNNYSYLPEVGDNENKDPYYFGLSLIRRIQSTPGQSIGTHTFSHYYCLEPGASAESFESDLAAAIRVAERRNISLKSIVFPRNQYAPEHLQICKNLGITCYRGNPLHYIYRPADGSHQTSLVRAMRLLDAHTGVFGPQSFTPDKSRIGMTNVPASRFLRPNAGSLARFHSIHVRTIMREMSHAARQGMSYHLWWHPHNFGKDIDQNIESLTTIIRHYCRLRDEHGFVSASMEGAAA